MNLPRFFCKTPLLGETELTLPDAVSHHIRVRRLKAGQRIVLFDGSGIEAIGILEFDKSGQASVSDLDTLAVDRELSFRVTLVQGIASQDRMDWVIEKAVELGVTRLIPVTAARSVVKLNDERATKRTAQWQKQIIAASEQCGRNLLMQIDPPCSVDQAIKAMRSEPMLLCHLGPGTVKLGDAKLLEAVKAAKAASIIVGPEGGWDDTEARRWLDAKAFPITLGERVLRTETAGLATIAGLVSLLG